MDNFSNRMAFINQYGDFLKNQPYIESLRLLYPNLFKGWERNEEDNIKNLKTKLYYAKLANQDVNTIIDDEISKCYQIVSKENNIMLLNIANSKMEAIGELLKDNVSTILENQFQLDDISDYTNIDKTKILSLAEFINSHAVQPHNSSAISVYTDEFEKLSTAEQEQRFKDIMNINNETEQQNMFFEHKIIKTWFVNKYFLRLVSESNDLKDPVSNKIENNERIEWNGTQKELAELFVELHRKKWIDEIPSKLIKQYFTKSDTIEQVLKPTQDKKTQEKSYEGIFTIAYRPRFDAIRQCSKKQ